MGQGMRVRVAISAGVFPLSAGPGIRHLRVAPPDGAPAPLPALASALLNMVYPRVAVLGTVGQLVAQPGRVLPQAMRRASALAACRTLAPPGTARPVMALLPVGSPATVLPSAAQIRVVVLGMEDAPGPAPPRTGRRPATQPVLARPPAPPRPATVFPALWPPATVRAYRTCLAAVVPGTVAQAAVHPPPMLPCTVAQAATHPSPVPPCMVRRSPMPCSRIRPDTAHLTMPPPAACLASAGMSASLLATVRPRRPGPASTSGGQRVPGTVPADPASPAGLNPPALAARPIRPAPPRPMPRRSRPRIPATTTTRSGCASHARPGRSAPRSRPPCRVILA